MIAPRSRDKRYEVSCEKSGCRTSEQAWAESPTYAGQILLQYGWRSHEMKWYCPRHGKGMQQ